MQLPAIVEEIFRAELVVNLKERTRRGLPTRRVGSDDQVKEQA